jgi:uncharacterized protein YdaU (DUF1376 family)
LSKSPAFQFYPDDFLGSGKVGVMTTDEVGAYTLLLCLDWNENGFIFDEEELSRWCRCSRAKFRKLWVRVSRCFNEHNGRMFNPRLELEREKQAEWRRKSSEGGKASAQAKAKGGARVVEPTGVPPTQPNVNTPSPTPSPVTEKRGEGAGAPPAARIVRAKVVPLPEWATTGAKVWEGLVGCCEAKRFHKALAPIVELFGADPVMADVRKWVESRRTTGKACRLEWYAEEASARLHTADQPLWDAQRECLTAYGERMTRPAVA